MQGGNTQPKIIQPSLADRIYDENGISTACTTVFRPKIIQRARGFNHGGEKELCPTIGSNSFQENNMLIDPKEVTGSTQKNAYVGSVDGPSPCINSACGMGGGQTPMITFNNSRIRRLTPTECFRLMDVSDKDINHLLNSGISNSQLYKLAGNSIVVSCLFHIFIKLFIETFNDDKQLELF
jgi:DNA (cytosine-5)-methyltransferase 1